MLPQELVSITETNLGIRFLITDADSPMNVD